MSLLHKYSSSARLAEEGKEFQLSEEGWITVRRGDAKQATRLREELEEPYQSILSVGGKIPPAKLREILVRVAAEGLVVSWRGKDWADEEGKVIEFSPEKCLEILSNPDQEPLVARIYDLAGNATNFRDEQVKKISGN